MTLFACMNFGAGSLLILLSVMLAAGMAVTDLLAVLLSRLFGISVRKAIVLEAVVLSLVYGGAYLLDVSGEGTQALSLLGAISCVALLAVDGIYVLVRRRTTVKGKREYSPSTCLNLDDRPTEF